MKFGVTYDLAELNWRDDLEGRTAVSPWWQRPGQDKEGRSSAEWAFSRIVFIFVAVIAVLSAAAEFSNGQTWVGVRHLAMALLFGLLAAKGPQLRSGNALGARLLVVAAFLVYLVLWFVQVILPLAR